MWKNLANRILLGARRGVMCRRNELNRYQVLNCPLHGLLPRAAFFTATRLLGLSDFQRKKIIHEFDSILDRNRDGFVDKNDIEAFKRKLREYVMDHHVKSRSAAYKAGYDDFWELFQDFADTNKDGQLSRDEWIELWTKVIDKSHGSQFTSLPQWIQMLPHNLFPVIDSKGDGVIDMEEYKNFWYHVAGYRADNDQILRKYFDIMTEGGKFQLDMKRFEDLFADFYLSDDTHSPGKYIAGPLEYE